MTFPLTKHKLSNGHETPALRQGIVKLILNGQNHKTKMISRLKAKELLKNNLVKCDLDKKFLIWSVATLAFCAGFLLLNQITFSSSTGPGERAFEHPLV
jgi:hypothetical protein